MVLVAMLTLIGVVHFGAHLLLVGFFVSPLASSFQYHSNEELQESSDLTLSCRANIYNIYPNIYRGLSFVTDFCEILGITCAAGTCTDS